MERGVRVSARQAGREGGMASVRARGLGLSLSFLRVSLSVGAARGPL